MINFTVFTIVYNGYGIYLDKWLFCIRKQTEQPKEIIVILGKDSGVDKDNYKGVTFYEFDSDIMGILRNIAIKNKKYKKCLYFSVDDELLPNAIAQIEKKFHQGFKVVGLKFNDLRQSGTREDIRGNITPIYTGMARDSFILMGQKNPKTWRIHNVPGWVAINGSWEYENIDIPNYPYIFKLRSMEIPMVLTDEVVANYIRRAGSHGDRAQTQNKFNGYVDEINRWVGKWQYTGI